MSCALICKEIKNSWLHDSKPSAFYWCLLLWVCKKTELLLKILPKSVSIFYIDHSRVWLIRLFNWTSEVQKISDYEQMDERISCKNSVRRCYYWWHLSQWRCGANAIQWAHLNVSPWGFNSEITVSSLLPLHGELIGWSHKYLTASSQCELQIHGGLTSHSKITIWAHPGSSLWGRWVASKWACREFSCEHTVC